LVAEGIIIQAVKEHDVEMPRTIRLYGTEAEEAEEMLRTTGLPFTIKDGIGRER
jgi:succinyl-CoA synthetase beta subunit